MMPDACQGTVALIPINIAPWLWGWPDRLLDRFEGVGSEVFVIGPYRGRGFADGIDRLEDLARLPAGYSGGIWTNEIEAVARALRAGRR